MFRAPFSIAAVRRVGATIVSLRPPQTPESVFSGRSSLVTVCVVWAMPDAGKLAACSRPIGSQIGDITKWTNRRPEAQLADQSGALKLVREKGREILCDVLSPQGYSVARRWENTITNSKHKYKNINQISKLIIKLLHNYIILKIPVE